MCSDLDKVRVTETVTHRLTFFPLLVDYSKILCGVLVSGLMKKLTVRGDKAMQLLESGLKVKEYEIWLQYSGAHRSWFLGIK